MNPLLPSSAWSSLCWTQLWQVSVVIAVVGLTSRYHPRRRRPHLAYILWMLVIVKCLTPPLWSSPTGVFSWAQAWKVEVAAAIAPTAIPHADFKPVLPDRAPPRVLENAPQIERPLELSTVSPAISPPKYSFAGLLTVLWLLGAIVLGCLIFARWLIWRQRLFRSIVSTPQAAELLKTELTEKIRVSRRTRLIITSLPVGPGMLGVIHPTIFLSASLLDGRDAAQIKPILAHELVHARRGDVLFGFFQLAMQLLWWFHPLVWWANRRASQVIEQCCDEEVIAGLGCRPETYARSLLDVLQFNVQAKYFAFSPGISVTSVTRKRMEDLMKRRNGFKSRMPYWCWAVVLLLAAIVLPGRGLAVPEMNAGTSEAKTAADSPAEAKPATSATEDSKTAAEHPGERLDFHGQVVDPDGNPVPGAKIYLVYYTVAELPPPPVRATSGPDGKFQFTMVKSDFHRGEVHEPWLSSQVVAVADGMGIGWQAGRYLESSGKIADAAKSAFGDLSAAEKKRLEEERAPVIRLVRDDVPITGRIIDAKGQPVAGATVRLLEIEGNRQNDLTDWLDAVEKRKEGYYKASKFLSPGLTGWLRNQLQHLLPAVTTDQDGRFRLAGVGRERIARLLLVGPGIATEQLYARTRPGPKLEVKIYADDAQPPAYFYYGADFSHAAIPSLPILGVVNDKDTHLPLAGVTILNGGFNLVYGPTGRDLIRTKTDEQGRYRLTGMPVGKDNTLLAVPPSAGPYLLSKKQIEMQPGHDAIEINFELKQGIPIRGRVTDEATGKPLSAQIDYYVFSDNPHAKSAPGFHGFDYTCFGNIFYTTDEQGRYSIPGLPGRGIVTVHVNDWEHYPRSVGAEKIKGGDKSFGLLMFKTDPTYCCPSNFAALKEVDPGEGAKEVEVNFTMVRQEYLEGTILDPEGRPLTGATFCTGLELEGWWPQDRETFRITDYRPDRPQTLLFIQHERKLAGSFVLQGPQHGPLAVSLQPWGTITGRVVDAQGKPQADVFIMDDPPEKTSKLPPQVPIESASSMTQIKTDSQGRFTIIGLAPGVAYDIDAAGQPEKGVEPWIGRIATGIVVQSGKTKDLGDLTPKLIDLSAMRNKEKKTPIAQPKGP